MTDPYNYFVMADGTKVKVKSPRGIRIMKGYIGALQNHYRKKRKMRKVSKLEKIRIEFMK